MAKLNVTSAARTVGLTRAALRRAIASGRVHRDSDGRVDTAELERAGYTLQTSFLPQEDDVSCVPRDMVRQALELPRTPVPSEQEGLPASATVNLALGGRQIQLTLHDTDVTRLLTRMEALLQQYPHGSTPASDIPPQEKRREPIRYRIYELLRKHPAGLTRREVEQTLGITNLADTLVGMVRHKRLIRVDKGTYALPPA